MYVCMHWVWTATGGCRKKKDAITKHVFVGDVVTNDVFSFLGGGVVGGVWGFIHLPDLVS